MPDPKLEHAVSDLVRSLPPSEAAVAALLEAAAARRPPREALALIRGDAGLAANLLRLANTACWRPAGAPPVATLEAALDGLGVEPLALLVGASYCTQALRPAAVPPARWTEYEQHGREIAAVCTLLARRLGLPPDECALYTVAGLTHDIGRAVIMVAADPAAASLLGTTPDALARIVREEKAAYGLNHCEIGERIFRNWRFSATLCDGILHHHAPLPGGELRFPAGLIFVSHFVTLSDFTGAIIARLLPAGLLAQLGATQSLLDEVRHAVLADPALRSPPAA